MRGIELLVTNKIENGLAVCLKPLVAPILTHSLVKEIRLLQNNLVEQYYCQPWNDIFYVVWYLVSGKIPWKGLDFNYIQDKLYQGNDQGLSDYIHDVFNLLFLNYIALGLPLINCSLVTRPLMGMSKEFFLLNQINFFKNTSSGKKDITHNRVKPEDLFHCKKSGCFPEAIYTRNLFYNFSSFNFSSMRKIISQSSYKAIDEDELIRIQSVFETIKKNTLMEIHLLYSKNPTIFDRFSRLQLVGNKQILTANQGN